MSPPHDDGGSEERFVRHITAHGMDMSGTPFDKEVRALIKERGSVHLSYTVLRGRPVLIVEETGQYVQLVRELKVCSAPTDFLTLEIRVICGKQEENT